jgi:hypothetical protein
MYREKQKYHRVRTNQFTKVSRERRRMITKKQKISEWWHKRMLNRRVFSEQYEKIAVSGTDYSGPLPWPDRVAFRALYEDFMLSEGEDTDINKHEFCVHMHQITKMAAGETKVKAKVGEWKWTTSITHLNLPR